MTGKLKYLALGALALSASVAAMSVAQAAGTGTVWISPAYPNNSSADQAAVANAIATSIPHDTFTFNNINLNFNSNGSTDYTIGTFLNTGGVTDSGANAGAGLDNTLFEFTASQFFAHDSLVTIDHDDGVTMIIDGINLGFDSFSTSEIAETKMYTGPSGVQSMELIFGEDDGPPSVLSLAVPEQSTWAMMVLGFAGLGFAAYRRGRKANVSIVSA